MHSQAFAPDSVKEPPTPRMIALAAWIATETTLGDLAAQASGLIDTLDDRNYYVLHMPQKTGLQRDTLPWSQEVEALRAALPTREI